MITQRRRTAGIRLVQGETHVHVDPGPGAVVFSNWARLSPQKLDGLIVTHCHPDHYTDAEVSISTYHQGLVGSIERMVPGHGFNVDGMRFEAVKAIHSDSETVGLRVETPDVGIIGYTSDTAYFPEMGELYRGVRLLMVCTMWPRDNPLKYHLCTDDAKMILEGARPGCAVLTHFGMKMLNADPEKEAAYLEEETGVPIVAARDGMEIILGETIEVKGSRKSDQPRFIEA
jgi:phosphoribosyl 1,2-cyclic phosphodiesterase